MMRQIANPLLLGRAVDAFPRFTSRPPWWGADMQTLRNTLVYCTPPLAAYASSRLFLPTRDESGDELQAIVNQPQRRTDGPTVMIVHGLTGDENSRNIIVSAAHHLGRGHTVIRLNLRGAGPSLGRCRHHYHAGRSQDLADAIAALPAALLDRGLVLVGVSLGGNILLKFLAENPPALVVGAAAVSAPIDLRRAQVAIMRPRNALYHWHLLRAMKQDAARSGDPEIAGLLADIRTVYQFDDLIVAPRNGFADARDYYRRASAAPRLAAIRVPTLLIHAANDPWIPVESYLERSWPQDGPLTLLVPPDGGHVGFHGADDPTPWHDRCISRFIEGLPHQSGH